MLPGRADCFSCNDTGHAVPRAADAPVRFEKKVLTNRYYCDGVTVGDVNREGKPAVVAGPLWFEGPGFAARHEFYPAGPFPLLIREAGKGSVGVRFFPYRTDDRSGLRRAVHRRRRKGRRADRRAGRQQTGVILFLNPGAGGRADASPPREDAAAADPSTPRLRQRP